MSLVATLVADPSTRLLTPEIVENAAAAVATNHVHWLAEAIACDVVLDGWHDEKSAYAVLREAVGSAPVDVVVQAAASRRKTMLIADMDSTMIGQECIDELAAEIGMKDAVAAITRRAMNGEIAFEPALRERVSLLAGLPVSVIDRVLETRITLAPGGPALVATMKANGAYTALVSGGFTAFTDAIAGRLGFDEHRANRLIAENGFLKGTVAEPILGKQAKVDTLDAICESRSIETNDVMAVGDGANDLGMLSLAGSGVALHAKPSVAEAAGMRIDHGDLTALLYIQGFHLEDFASAS